VLVEATALSPRRGCRHDWPTERLTAVGRYGLLVCPECLPEAAATVRTGGISERRRTPSWTGSSA